MWTVVAFVAIITGVSANADTFQAVPEINADPRIVSGWEAREGQFPYMIYLRTVRWTGDVTACGGSIIHRSWGLTSARCTAQRVEIIVQAGSVSLKAPRVTLQVTSSFRPPGYDDTLQPITQPNDISVIRFSQDLTFNSNIQPIRLQRSADMNRDYERVRMTTSGWGSTETCNQLTCPTPDILNWTYLSGWTNFMCLLAFNSNYLVRQTTICAGPYNVTSQSICAGDGGVPLTTIDVDGGVTQIGVGSFVSNFGCHVGLPGAFTRPGHFLDWIRQVTGINFDWNPRVAADEINAQAQAQEYSESLKY